MAFFMVGVGSSIASTAAFAQANPCAGTYILCDDFSGSSIDASKWTVANVDIASKYPVRPANIALTTVNDNGTPITVVDVKSFGDTHTAAPRQGGILITKLRYGGGRYEVRMKNLPGPNGYTCFWNYYDSLNEANPPRDTLLHRNRHRDAGAYGVAADLGDLSRRAGRSAQGTDDGKERYAPFKKADPPCLAVEIDHSLAPC